MNNIIELFRKELLEVALFKDKTVRMYMDIVYEYADYAKQGLKINLSESKSHHINNWFIQLKTNGKSCHAMKNYKAVLNRFFTFLVKTGHMKTNPAENLPRVRIPKSDLNKPVSKETLYALLNSFNRNTWMGLRNFTIVSILWALGLRVNELLSLKVKDVQLDYDPDQRIGTLLVHGKGGKERTLFIVDALYDTFFKYLRAKKTSKRKNSLLFSGNKSKIICGARVRQLIKEAAKRIGITDRITPHVFRHTFATDMYNQKVPVDVIREMMGHDMLRETSIYIHVSDELQAEVLKKISIKEQVS
jgi:site-specific recombinase XerD